LWAIKSETGGLLTMKILGIGGIVLFLLGGLVLIIGLVVCLTTWNSDYATSACTQAENDKEKFALARQMCSSTSNDCYKQATIGLTSEDDCTNKTEFMNKQMLMGAVPAVLGFIVGGIGLIMAIVGFVGARKRKAAATA
jgi:ABC-type antimicrobial peptide transport system permease subunit